jgi:hypothetical protein
MLKKIFLMAAVLLIALSLTARPVFAAGPVTGGDALVWVIKPTLKYEDVSYYPEWAFIGYTSDSMFILDEKTGNAKQEIEPTGGFGNPYSYGYHSATKTFCYNEEYEYTPVKNKTVIEKSKKMVLSIHELTLDNKVYEWKEDSKSAIYHNGRFVSDFTYDRVVGGNSIAFVEQNGTWALADNSGKLLTGFDFDDVSVVAQQYAAVKKGETWGFLDLTGKEAIPFMFEGATTIDKTTAFVKYNGYYGILDVLKTALNMSN